jgi:poly-gamma-glutamate synthesis protein (capsule biosynthesis protein)
MMLDACAPGPQTTPTWHASPAPPEASPSASAVPPRDLVLDFAGDVHFTGRTLSLLNNPATAFGPIAALLRDADLTMVNLETAVTERGTEQPKTFHFRAPATAFEALRAAGIDVASIANNHTLDYGPVGLLDTLNAAREAQFPVVGAGRNTDEAYRPLFVTVRGTNIGIVAMSQVHELAEQWKPTVTRPGIAMAFDRDQAVAAVASARRQADLVIVFMHWGIEGNSCPSAEMKSFAAAMAGAGADIIAGTHAHTLLGGGWRGRTYVHFGLGNFLWYGDSHSTDSGVLRLTVHGRDVVGTEFIPATVSATGQPVVAGTAAATRIEAKLASVQGCTGLSRTRS